MSKPEPAIDEARARELLRRERERIEGSLADLGRLRGSEVEALVEENELQDEGEQLEEEQVDDAVVAQLHVELEAVERAEARLRDGTYGLSVESGAPISAERLEAIPWAERTPEEQERFERTHGGAL
jgi:DnaK suppressor protein